MHLLKKIYFSDPDIRELKIAPSPRILILFGSISLYEGTYKEVVGAVFETNGTKVVKDLLVSVH